MSTTKLSDAVDAESSISSGAVHNLRSVEQVELLDAIDRLRCENIDADIGIPQVVVCGDQSSGKSSLLEAIAQVPFPAGSGTCTLFPTELVLRNADRTDIRISIEPAKDRSLEERQHLRAFRHGVNAFGHDDFLELHEAASEYLKNFEPDRGFWYDRLRAEISGPDQPHLSCIDLPGLFLEASHKLNQQPEDVAKIRQLTTEYIHNPRTVVIAVVSATADFQTQLIGNLISNSGDVKARTLGVITKPDRVTERDDARRKIAVARNEELQLGLGWHVVKNLSHEAHDRSQAHRDAEERDFFQSSIWSDLPAGNLGITSLRERLSHSLLNCVKEELPELIAEMEKNLVDIKRALDRLGPARQSPKDHRIYLTNIASKLRGLVTAAVNGDILDGGCDGFFDGVEAKKLRNIITKRGDDFAGVMRERGKQFCIEDEDNSLAVHTVPELPEHLTPNFSPPYSLRTYPSNGHNQWRLPFRRYCEDLAAWMRENRGKDLRGLVKRDNIQAIFRQQSDQWEVFTYDHVYRCHAAALDFMRLAVEHVAGPHTGRNIMLSYVLPSFDAKTKQLEGKTAELLWPYRKCHLITDNPAWLTNTSTHTAAHREDEAASMKSNHSHYGVGSRWSTIAQQDGYSSEYLVAANALDRAEVYYDIAINTFIDNVLTLAVERCLLGDLPDIVALDDIAGLDDVELATIGAEPAAAHDERAKANAQSVALEDVIRTCRRHTSVSSYKTMHALPQVQSPGLSNVFESLSVTTPTETSVKTPQRRKRTPMGTGGLQHGLLTPEPSPGYRMSRSTPSPSDPRRADSESTSTHRSKNQGFGRPSNPPSESFGSNATVSDGSDDGEL